MVNWKTEKGECRVLPCLVWNGDEFAGVRCGCGRELYVNTEHFTACECGRSFKLRHFSEVVEQGCGSFFYSLSELERVADSILADRPRAGMRVLLHALWAYERERNRAMFVDSGALV